MLTPTLALLALSLSGPATVTAGAETAAAVPAQRAAEPNYASIVADRAPAMALIKFIITFDAGGQSQDVEGEAMALMIDPKGLLVMSGAEIGQRKGMSANPKEIKVCIGDDTEGVLAKLIGRDSDLDLAWLRIEKPADKGYSALDLSKAATPKLGDTLVGLDKMGKYFDHAAVAFTTMVGGVTKKPRTLYIPSPGGGMEMMFVGIPFFTTGGELVGMSVVQMPNADSEDGMNSRVRERLTRFDRGFKILPASEIASATTRAVEAEKGGKGVGMDEPKPEEKKDDAEPAKVEPGTGDPMKKD